MAPKRRFLFAPTVEIQVKNLYRYYEINCKLTASEIQSHLALVLVPTQESPSHLLIAECQGSDRAGFLKLSVLHS